MCLLHMTPVRGAVMVGWLRLCFSAVPLVSGARVSAIADGAVCLILCVLPV